MEPFNIKICYGDNDVTLTILPMPDNQYKVIYYGAILGALKHETDTWEVIPPDDLEAGDLPFYQHNSDNINIILDAPTVGGIGHEIEYVIREEEQQ
jgi:hypothetical protein